MPGPGATYLARWSLPSGRLLSTTRIDSGSGARGGLIDDGRPAARRRRAHASACSTRSSLRRLSSVAITPAPAAPSAAAFSPDGRTIALGSQTGQVSFVDASTGDARPGTGAHSSPVTSVAYSPDGRAVVSTGNNSKVIVWNPRPQVRRGLDRPGGASARPSRSARTEARSTHPRLGGVLLEWDLTGDRSFGRRFALGARIAMLRRGLAARPTARALAGWHDVRRPPRHLHRRTVLDPHAAAPGIVHDQTQGHRRSPRSRGHPPQPELAVGGYSGLVQLVARGRRAPAGALADRPARRCSGGPKRSKPLAFSPDGQLLAASDSNETAESPAGGGIPWHSRQPSCGAGDLASEHRQTGSAAARPRDRARSLSARSHSPTTAAASREPCRTAAIRSSTPRQIRSGKRFIRSAPTTPSRSRSRPTGRSRPAPRAGSSSCGTRSTASKSPAPWPSLPARSPASRSTPPASGSRPPAARTERSSCGSPPRSSRRAPRSTPTQDATTTAAFAPGGAALLVIDDHGNGFTWPTSLAAWEQRACTVAGTQPHSPGMVPVPHWTRLHKSLPLIQRPQRRTASLTISENS